MMREHFLTTDSFPPSGKNVKSVRPFIDLPTDIDLQVLNGIDMGRSLLKERFVSSALDGASVMLKNKSGVAAKNHSTISLSAYLALHEPPT